MVVRGQTKQIKQQTKDKIVGQKTETLTDISLPYFMRRPGQVL
jgi:hypothetical protein